MYILIIEKDMRLKRLKDAMLPQTSKEKCLIHIDAPLPSWLDRSQCCRTIARRDQCGPDGRKLNPSGPSFLASGEFL